MKRLYEKLKTFGSIEESNRYLEDLKRSSQGVTKLSILIATTVDRRLMFNTLMQDFHRQIEQGGFKGAGRETWTVKVPVMKEDGGPKLDEKGEQLTALARQSYRHPDVVELVYEEDDKETSVGSKRQRLLERATGDYVAYFDSDDFPRQGYVTKIMGALGEKPDCVGFKIAMTTNGVQPETCVHSLRNPRWDKKDGVWLRNVTHFNPVRRDLALQVGFQDLRYGEDKPYSDAVSKLCKKEVFLDEFLFDYRYSTKEEHNKKYGITG